jgi:signal transduction histidine kinase
VTRKCFILLIWLTLPLCTLGQNLNLIDSIRHKLSVSEGRQRFNLLNSLAWEYRFAHPDSTVFYSNQAYNLGRKLDLSKGLAQSLNYVGIAYNYKGERLLAFENYNKALQVAIGQRDSLQIAHANNNIGRLFYDQGLLSRSYDYFVKARFIFHAINDSSGLAYAYQSLANLYKTQRDYRKAEDSYLKAYRLRLKLGNSRDIMSALNYLGRLYLESEQLDKSIHYFRMADSTGHVINDEINLAEIKVYLSESYLKKGLLKEAETMTASGIDVIVKRSNVRLLPQAYNIIGQIMLEKKDYKGAKQYFHMALDVATRIKDLNAQMKAYFYLWKVSEKQNDTIELLKNHNQYLVLKDSIKDLDLARQVERLQFEIEIQRKEQENELLKANHARTEATIQQQRLENIILIAIIGFITILGFLIWRNGVKRREANEKLVGQNAEIQKQREEIVKQNEKLSKRNQQLSDINHEKDTLMSIVAHDLKSPLNRIKGITDIMELEGVSDDQRVYIKMTKDATQAGLDLITDLLDVHMLEENVEPNYTTFDLSKFLLEKMQHFMPAAEAKNIHLYITRVSNDLIFTDLDYLSRIMDNLLSNAIKFSDRNATVVVAAGKLADEFWISIKDQGPGFSSHDRQMIFQKFKKLSAKPTAGETSNGLGLAIVKTLVDRLNGNIELTTEKGKGSEFIVRIPTVKETV